MFVLKIKMVAVQLFTLVIYTVHVKTQDITCQKHKKRLK
jgi:hypothetical protein